jgi:hypothetical protein
LWELVGQFELVGQLQPFQPQCNSSSVWVDGIVPSKKEEAGNAAPFTERANPLLFLGMFWTGLL